MDQVYKLNKNKLTQVESVNFDLEREIQTIVENNTEELFELKVVKSEFSVGGYRIDTLCFDEETKSFVIIEYKKNKSYSVIDQGYSYLSTMINNKSDFVLGYIENTDKKIKRDQIDWSQSRIIFVSPSFSSHQKNSVNFKDVPFELWEITKISKDLIGFNQITSSSKESITKIGQKKGSVITDVGKEIKVYDEEYHLNRVSSKSQNLFLELKERMSSWEDVRFGSGRDYVSVKKKNKNKIYLNLQKNRIKIHLLSKVDFTGHVRQTKIKFILKDPSKMFVLRKSKYKEQYEFYLEKTKDIEYLVLMLKQKYDS
mgnify:CR=1 FL=1